MAKLLGTVVLLLLLVIFVMWARGASTTINVVDYGATGNGTTDDTAAIYSAIGALASGATLFFPCGTYLISSRLSVNIDRVTIDGGSCAVVRGTEAGGNIMVIGNGAFTGSYGPAIALSGVANELSTSFSTVSDPGLNAGDYVYIHQGGMDYSTDTPPGHPSECDVSGCRGEILKVLSVTGNTVTVTTALHDTSDPSVNAAVVQKVLNPVTGVTLKDITLDGSGTENYGLLMLGVVDSTVSGVTVNNVLYTGLYGNGNFNLAWNRVATTNAGNASGAAMGLYVQGNPSINGASISSLNSGPSARAFGFAVSGTGNGTFSNITVDASGAYGRPFKTTATRYSTFNSVTVKDGASWNNGISLEYYSSHNTFNDCVLTGNGGGARTGNGNAGINSFGNFNQYNTFNDCTVAGNGDLQVLVGNFDALRLGQDSYVTIKGGTYTGSNSTLPVVAIVGANPRVRDARINGPGGWGLYLRSEGACVNNNIFGGGGIGKAISSNSSTNVGLGNVLNGYTSDLAPGTCPGP